MKRFRDLKKQLLKNKEIKKAYADLESEYAIVEQLIDYRLQKGISQADIAKRLGTKQSAISRFESGTSNPSINFIYKVANALDAKIKITIS